MDVGLGIFWWLKLYNQRDPLNIKSPGRNIRGYQNLELALSIPLNGGLPLILRDATMHDLAVMIEIITLAKLVSIPLGGCEDYHFAIARVNRD